MHLMRASVLSWHNIHQLAIITPNDILEITAMVGKEVEELALFLDKKMFPGIMTTFAEQYMTVVLKMLPAASVPSREEVVSFIQPLLAGDASFQSVRDKTTARFSNRVNVESPEFAKRAMMAMIEFTLGEWEDSLHSAGFAQCLHADPLFDEQMGEEGGLPEEAKSNLMASERTKAEVLVEIIRERRLSA